MTSLFIDCRFPQGLRRLIVRTSIARLPDVLECILHKKIAGSVTIVGVPDRVMRTLNRRYRGKDKTTDVLSFLYAERQIKKTKMIVGDILLSMTEVRRQAGERKLSVAFIAHELIVHGVLHLLGYDHERSTREAKIMFDLQKKILGSLQNSLS